MVKHPILLLIFNRPETTQLVFNIIKTAKPTVLYIAADGPRNENEKLLCETTRKITENIEWDCKVKRLYRYENLGCRVAVIDAINWFFDNEESGIILEDDCVPDITFFQFCDILLDKYGNDSSVKTISGSNFLFNKNISEDNFYFLNYTLLWGWATWKRTWDNIDWDSPIPENLFIKKINTEYNNSKFCIWITNFISHFYKKFYTITDIWDVHVLTTILIQDGLNIIPSKNLISNIGVNGTHQFENNKAINTSLEHIDISKFNYSKKIEVDKNIQKIFMQNVVDIYMQRPSLINQIKSKLIRFVK